MLPFYEFQPSDINIIHNRRELKFRSHMHKEIEIIYVSELGQHINIDGTDYEILEGQAAVIFPNTVHTYYRDKWRGTDATFLIISQKLFLGLFPDLTDFSPENPIITDVGEAVKLAFMQLTLAEDFSEKLAWSLVIISRLIKKLTLTRRDSEPVKQLTQKLITYISEHFLEDITLDLLAHEFSVSKYYISHTFTDKIKISLPNYLALIRAEYAASLIRTTDQSITSICTNSGFSSQSTFNRAFKKVYRMTPREYKNNICDFYKKN